MYALFQLLMLKFFVCCHPVPISTVQIHKRTAAVCCHSCRGWCDALTAVALVLPLAEAGASLCRNCFLWKAQTGDVIQVVYPVNALCFLMEQERIIHTYPSCYTSAQKMLLCTPNVLRRFLRLTGFTYSRKISFPYGVVWIHSV